jgi:phosphatidylserine/phosphatidylglycerophosphate/cardiolipin synthase-like enzyme
MQALAILSIIFFLSGVAMARPAEQNATSNELPQLSPFVVRTVSPHKALVIDNSVAAFEKRLQMIENAKSKILLEYYIFESQNESYSDDASRTLLRALIKKARTMTKKIITTGPNQNQKKVVLINPETGNEFQIKLLLDYYSWPGFPAVNEYLAQILALDGIEVRYFNVRTAIFSPIKVHFRNHRKFFISDIEGCTGGRNIAVDYFGMWNDGNYLDRDICIQGELANSMAINFDEFWKHEMTSAPKKIDETRAEYKLALDYLFPSQNKHERLSKVMAVYRKNGARELESIPVFEVDNAELITDRARFDLTSKNKDSSFVSEIYFAKFRASQYVTIENYNLINHGKYKLELEKILDSGVSVDLVTNSLASDNAIKTMKLSYKSQAELAKKYFNIRIFAYSGEVLSPNEIASEEFNVTRHAIHSKTAVFDDETCIGTNNLDPRSNNLNLEAMVCIKNWALSHYVNQAINVRKQKSWLVLKNGNYLDLKNSVQITWLEALRKLYPNYGHNLGDRIGDVFLEIAKPLF